MARNKSEAEGFTNPRASSCAVTQPTPSGIVSNEPLQDEIARQGMRYGDPSRPCFATGRADRKAPPFVLGDIDGVAVGKQRRRP